MCHHPHSTNPSRAMPGKDLACAQAGLLKKTYGRTSPHLNKLSMDQTHQQALLLKEAGAPLKDPVKDTQFRVGVPHGGLALVTKVRSHRHHNPTHVAAQLDIQNAFGTMHRKACIEQFEKHINSQEPWFLFTKNLWNRSVAIPHSQEKDIFETSDGVPPRGSSLHPDFRNRARLRM